MKNCIITGGNSGIGYAAAMQIAELDVALTLICRNEQRAKKRVEKLGKRPVIPLSVILSLACQI